MTTKSSAIPPERAKAVAAAQGLRWVLDDLLQAQDDLLALLATPSGLPREQRGQLLFFCEQIGKACAERKS